MRESFKSFLCGLVAVIAGILLIATFGKKLPWVLYVLIAILLKEGLYFFVKKKPSPEPVKEELEKPLPEPVKAEVKRPLPELPEPMKEKVKEPLPEPAKAVMIEGPWE